METTSESINEVKVANEQSDILEGTNEISFEVEEVNDTGKAEEKVVVQKESNTPVMEFLNKIKSLFSRVVTEEHLTLYKSFLERKETGLLLDLSSYSVFLDQAKQSEFTALIDNLRKYFQVIVVNEKDCRNRLLQLRSKISSAKENEIVNNALKLLDYPEQAEVTSNADYELFNLSSKMNGRREIVEIQELFLYLNNMFETPQPMKQPKKR
jgi:hypothetical protein